MSKDAFLANVSHEMKTPIHAILGMVHFLRRETLSPRQAELVDKIQHSADFLLALVNDVLDLSRMEEKQWTLQPSNSSIQRLVNYVEDLLLDRIRSKGLDWKVCTNYPGDLLVRVDSIRLCQVLTNLIGNAIKYTTTGGIRLEITAVSHQRNTVDLEFAVIDTGCGIAPESQKRIFEEFDQGRDAALKYHPGFGLGLTICKHIAEAMEGQLTLESKVGEGSRFSLQIRVPLLAGSGPAELLDASEQGYLQLKPGSCPDFLQKGPVLVVEDTDLSAEIAAGLLREIGVKAERADDGRQALDLLRAKGPGYYSLILMDVHMPRMNGYEAAETIALEQLCHCPVLAMTATLVDRDVYQRYRHCLSGFLLKPFKAETFYQQIAAVLARQEGDLFGGKGRALRDLGGREDLYERYLLRFRNAYCDGTLVLQSYLRKNRTEEAHRLVHSVKGLAATLGLDPLRDAAENLEAALSKELPQGEDTGGLAGGAIQKAPAEIPPVLIRSFCSVLDQTIQAITAKQ